MEIQAAVVRQPGGPFRLETLTLEAPLADEILVRIVATGLCHSDIIAANFDHPPSPPVVFGHEGAGVVEQVGANVTHLVPGDHVVLSFASCGACWNCQHGHVAYCEQFFQLNLAGARPDGSATLHCEHGAVSSCFFRQSSFATYALAHQRNTVKVRKDAPLELLGPLGCGIQTGCGAVVNVLKPEAGSSLAVFGCGGVGLAAVMGAKMSGCGVIVAIDRVPGRLGLAKELGATHTIDASKQNVLDILNGLGGMHYTVEATGVPAVLAQAIQVLRPHGTAGVVGIPKPGATVTLDIGMALSMRTVVGIIEGDADPQQFIPWLVDKFMAGELPLDLISKFYSLDQIETAIADSKSGATIKPIIRMS